MPTEKQINDMLDAREQDDGARAEVDAALSKPGVEADRCDVNMAVALAEQLMGVSMMGLTSHAERAAAFTYLRAALDTAIELAAGDVAAMGMPQEQITEYADRVRGNLERGDRIGRAILAHQIDKQEEQRAEVMALNHLADLFKNGGPEA